MEYIKDDSEFGCIYADSIDTTFKPPIIGKITKNPLNFNDIKLGTWLKVTANLLEMPFNEPDERLFNLYCTDIQIDYSKTLFQSEVKDDVKVFLNNVHVAFNLGSKVKQCKKGWIFYGDFGSILILDEYSPMFNIRRGHFLGTLRSMIQGVGKDNEYVCWMLCPTFNVYRKNHELHQKCVDSVFQPVPKKPRRQRQERPNILQTAFERYPDEKNDEAEKETPYVVFETLPPRAVKNVGERLGDVFFRKKKFR
uniref:Uncharacterized protein n=1 Tax=Panagrolaimus sp. PS1159 TaxID=55785 RepID=A0AC35GKG1_9BILA